MPHRDPESFAKDYFAKNPNATIEEALKAYDAQPEEEGFLTRAADAVLPTALRVGGGVLGGVIGAAGGPAGAIAGGALGSGVGEAAAEGYETLRGERSGLNPVQIAFQSLLGAVPLGRAKALLPSQIITREAVKGGALGATAAAGTRLAEGEKVSPVEVAQGALLGTGLGAIGGKLASKARPVPQKGTTIPKLEVLEAEREAAKGVAKAAKPGIVEKITPKAFTRKFVNQFTDVDDFVAKGEKLGAKVAPEEDPRIINDLVYGGTGGRIQNAMDDFRSIRDDAQRRGLGPALERYLDLQFMKHGADTLQEHAAKASQRGDMIEALTIQQKLHRGKSLPQGYTPKHLIEGELGADTRTTLDDDVAALGTQLGEKLPEVEGLAKRVFEMNRKALDAVHQAGIVSDDVYKQLLARPDNYGPLTRILDTAVDDLIETRAKTNLSLQQQEVLFNLRGSQKNTKNPLEASMLRMQEAIREAGRNEAARTFANLRNVHPSFASQIIEVAPGAKVPQGMGTLGFYENGVKKTIAVPEEIANAMNLAEGPEVKVIGNATLGFFRNMLQKLATGANLAFAVPNVIRDVQDARKLSTAYKPYNVLDATKFVGEYAASLKQALMKDPDYRAFLESRAGFSTLQKNIDPELFLKDETSVNPLNAVAKVNSLLEEGTKLTTFKRLKGAGKSDVEAAIETRRFGGSPDFARRGTASTEANLMFMFFNASVQGITRNFTRLNPVTNPGRFATLMMGAATTAAALDRWNAQFTDPDGTNSMDRVSKKDLQNYFVMMRPETYKTAEGVIRHRYYKVPKGHLARLIMNPIQEATGAALSAVTGTSGWQQRGTGETIANAISGTSPVNIDLDARSPNAALKSVASGAVASLNPALRAPLEQIIGAGGQDTFRGVPIVPRRLQDVAASEQFDATTSPAIVKAAQALNEALGPDVFQLSPKRVESFLRTGPLVGPGEAALKVVDALVKPPVERKLEGDEAVGEIPLVGTIAKRFVGSSVDQIEADTFEKFYELRSQSDEANRTLAHLKSSDPMKARAFAQENRVLLSAAPTLRKLGEGFAKIRKARQLNPEQSEALGRAERALLEQAQEIQKLIEQNLNAQRKSAGDKPQVGNPATSQGSAPLTRERVDSLYSRFVSGQ